MIEWIKFKGSTEALRAEEVRGSYPVILANLYDSVTIHDQEDFYSLYKKDFTCWALLNLPQEEKWKRKCDHSEWLPNNSKLADILNKEFDNIYSIVNELKDELRKK